MNAKIYEYDTKVYRTKITITAIFCAFILVYSLFSIFTTNVPALWVVAAVVAGYYAARGKYSTCTAGYFVWETFVSIANPSKVEVSDQGITFSAYHKSHHYDWNEVKRFKCKPLASGTKMFVRINEAGIFRGRYWVNCYYFNDGNELFQYLFHKEVEIDPEGLKARAVRGSEETKSIKRGRARRK